MGRAVFPRDREISPEEVYKALLKGETLVLSTVENQYGDQEWVKWLTFENGEWVLGRLNCWSSIHRGMGTCQCNSHPTDVYSVISGESADKLVHEFVDGHNRLVRKRIAEIERVKKFAEGQGES